MFNTKSELLNEKIILAKGKLEQIILPEHILTDQSLNLSKKLDKLILKYYRLEQTLNKKY
ncbi:hypothetical protein [Clostridium sp.]|jgi:hypothetical protein|uniref:hypothetical protein n=1 Tax=Clostridium sp. TaxID=1506 RepID=UPI003EEFB2AA